MGRRNKKHGRRSKKTPPIPAIERASAFSPIPPSREGVPSDPTSDDIQYISALASLPAMNNGKYYATVIATLVERIFSKTLKVVAEIVTKWHFAHLLISLLVIALLYLCVLLTAFGHLGDVRLPLIRQLLEMIEKIRIKRRNPKKLRPLVKDLGLSCQFA